jgi:hypothetical protein
LLLSTLVAYMPSEQAPEADVATGLLIWFTTSGVGRRRGSPKLVALNGQIPLAEA